MATLEEYKVLLHPVMGFPAHVDMFQLMQDWEAEHDAMLKKIAALEEIIKKFEALNGNT